MSLSVENHPFFFGKVLYFSSLALIALLLLKLVFLTREEKLLHLFRQKLARTALAFTSAIILTALTFSWTPPDYRVLQDEATLTSISYMMAEHHTAAALYAAHYQGGHFIPLAQTIDKRPPLFPLFTHFLNLLRGYSPSNPFYINACTLVFLLGLGFFVTASLYGNYAGWIAQFLVISQPSIYLSATSAGFDLFSSTFLFATLALSVFLLRSPRSSIFGFWGLTLTALCFTRYESALFALIIASATFYYLPAPRLIFLKKEIKWITPIIYFLALWLILTNFLFEPRFHEVQNGRSVFAWSNFSQHLSALFIGLFTPTSHYPHLSLFYFVAVLSGIFVVSIAWKNRRTLGGKIFLIGILVVIVSLGISLFHFFGSYTDPAALRLFINPMMALALMPAIALGIAGERSTRVKKLCPVFVIVAASFAYFATHTTTQSEFFSDVGGTRGYQLSRQAIAALNPRTTLIVSDVPTNFAILKYGSIDFETFAANQSKILASLRNGELSEVLFFQNISRSSHQPQNDEELPNTLPVRLVSETAESSRHLLRVSELIR